MRSATQDITDKNLSLFRPDMKLRTLRKADLHLHTTYSDGQMTVRELLEHVATTDLSVIAITDHDTLKGAQEAQRLARQHLYPFEIIVGEEVTTRDGDIVGLFLSQAVPPRLSAAETVRRIHLQGGLAFAAHPFFRAAPGQRVMGGVGGVLPTLPLDALEVDNSTPLLERANAQAARYALTNGLAALGNSDAHILEAVGKSYTLFRGVGAEDLRGALLRGEVQPGAESYTPAELLAYLAFYLRYTVRDWGERFAGAPFAKRVQEQLRTTAQRVLEEGSREPLASQQRQGDLTCR